MAQVHLTLDSETLKGLFTKEGKDQAFGELISSILNQVLNEQANEQAGAGDPYLSKRRFIVPLDGRLADGDP